MSVDFSAAAPPALKVKLRLPRSLDAQIQEFAPELAFDQAPGELFVVRVAGNFVTQTDWVALSMGLQCWAQGDHVLGHTSCGAVNATVEALGRAIRFQSYCWPCQLHEACH